jgi:hypothetical protein
MINIRFTLRKLQRLGMLSASDGTGTRSRYEIAAFLGAHSEELERCASTIVGTRKVSG